MAENTLPKKCECHERDSSQTCSYCQSQGYFGHMQEGLEAAWREKERQKYACDVCGNWPDDFGVIEHGRGCFVVSENGGGLTYVDAEMFNG